jgi:hypothetical protein
MSSDPFASAPVKKGPTPSDDWTPPPTIGGGVHSHETNHARSRASIPKIGTVMPDRSAHDVPATTTSPAPADAPVVDKDGLLRFDGKWVAITDTQLPVIELLVRRYGTLVSNDEVLAAYGSAGGAATTGALRPLVYRLRRRLATVGLTLHVVRSRGVMLEATKDPPQ